MEPQRSLAELVPQAVLSRRLSAPPRRSVPFPALSENTLVLSDCAVLAPVDGQLCLSVRCAAQPARFFFVANIRLGLM